MSGSERSDIGLPPRRATGDGAPMRVGAARDPGDAWVTAADGNRYWGRFGAAGLLALDHERGVLLQHRVDWSDHGGTWGIPGGARHEGELAVDGAIRESHEEAGVPHDAVAPRWIYEVDRGGWTYTTVIADVVQAFEPVITDPESVALVWVPLAEVGGYELHPGFGASWPLLRPLLGGSTAQFEAAAAGLPYSVGRLARI